GHETRANHIQRSDADTSWPTTFLCGRETHARERPGKGTGSGRERNRGAAHGVPVCPGRVHATNQALRPRPDSRRRFTTDRGHWSPATHPFAVVRRATTHPTRSLSPRRPHAAGAESYLQGGPHEPPL